jgi:transposase
MKRVMTKMLNLPGVIVEECLETKKTIILSVRLKNQTAVCPRCGQISHRIHQNKTHHIRDLPISNREVILKVNRRQFKCKPCEKPFSEKLYFVENRKNFTQRYAQAITNQVIHSDINNVAKNNDLTAEQVESMVSSSAKSLMKVEVKNVRRLGIDEISLVKGQGKFIVVLVDLETHKLLALAPERKQSVIEKVMLKWGTEVLNKIEEISMDMSGNYKSLMNKICPNASITVDRFHVTKMLHEELNQARIDQKKVAESLNLKERTKLFGSLKGSKYILLKAEPNLSSKQKKKLLDVKTASPLVGIMHSLKEEFSMLFENSDSLGEGTLELIDWLKRAEPYYRKSVPTIERWFSSVVGYFEQRTTNGIVEGINNKLKLLKRSGFGFRNFNNARNASFTFLAFS